MGQKVIITGWRTNNRFDSINKVSQYVYGTGFKHSNEVSLYGSKIGIGTNITYLEHLNRIGIIEECLKNQLFIIRIILGGINVVNTSIGLHVEIGVFNIYAHQSRNVNIKLVDMMMSSLSEVIITTHNVVITWSTYYINDEVNPRYAKLLVKLVRPRVKKKRVYSYKNIYTYNGLCMLMCISGYGNVTDIISRIIAGILIRSQIHKKTIKGINKILDKYSFNMRGLGNRDDVQFMRNIYQGVSIKIKGTISGSRRTMTINMQRGKLSKGTISSAIVSSYSQAKTSTGTRGVTVSYIY